jgi:hypothetical protein
MCLLSIHAALAGHCGKDGGLKNTIKQWIRHVLKIPDFILSHAEGLLEDKRDLLHYSLL